MLEIEIAWAAGIIDGEGYIGLRKNNKTDSYCLVLQVNMTHKETIEKLCDIFQVGSVKYYVRRNLKHRNMYHWVISSKNCIKVLELIYKYSITKREHIILALEYANNCMTEEHRGRYSYTDVLVKDKMNAIYKDMTILNKRGTGL